jgi:hypothetical protein
MGAFLFKYFITFVKIYNMKLFLSSFFIFFLFSGIKAQVKDSIIENIYDEHYIVKRNDRFLLLDSQKNVLQDCDSIYRTHVHNREYVIAKKEKWGVIGLDGKVRIPFEYDYIWPWYFSLVGAKGENAHTDDDSNDGFFVQKNNKIGKINFKNEIVLPIDYDAITDWVDHGPDGHYVSKNGKIGLLNYNNESLIPAIYDSLYVASYDDLIKAKLNGKFGVVNLKHEILIPFNYDALMMDTDAVKDNPILTLYLTKYIVKINDEWMYLNKKGKIKERGITQKEILEKYVFPESPDPYWMLNNKDFKYVGYCMIKPKKI